MRAGLPPEVETEIKDLERRNERQADEIASLRELARNQHHRYEQLRAEFAALREMIRTHFPEMPEGS